MLEQASVLIFIVIALALIFDFVNGFHDTANAIATCVSTRAVPPAVAIIMSAVLNFAGAMISTGVAKTIGGDIVQSASMVNEVIIIARSVWCHHLEPDYLVVRYAEQLLARTRRRYHRCCYLFRRLHGSERLRYFKHFLIPRSFTNRRSCCRLDYTACDFRHLPFLQTGNGQR